MQKGMKSIGAKLKRMMSRDKVTKDDSSKGGAEGKVEDLDLEPAFVIRT